MSILGISNAFIRSDILPATGASIASFEAKVGDAWLPVMRPTALEAMANPQSGQMSSFNLVPWSNRIVGAAFDFQGKHYRLRANTPQGFAIHGDARERTWHVTNRKEQEVTCSLDTRAFPDFNYPFPFTATVRYALAGRTLITMFQLTNVGDTAMPAGWGFHPYFNRRLGALLPDDAHLQFHAEGVYPPLPGMQAVNPPAAKMYQQAGDRSPMVDVPGDMDFSQPAAIGERDIDHCFGGWDGRASITYPRAGIRIDIECEPVLNHVIIYTPPGKPFFAVEPVTHANDAFNMLTHGATGSGARVLQPGEQFTGTFLIHVVIQQRRVRQSTLYRVAISKQAGASDGALFHGQPHPDA